MSGFKGTFGHNWREEDTCFLLLPSSSPAHCCSREERRQHHSDSRGSSRCPATRQPASGSSPAFLADRLHALWRARRREDWHLRCRVTASLVTLSLWLASWRPKVQIWTSLWGGAAQHPPQTNSVLNTDVWRLRWEKVKTNGTSTGFLQGPYRAQSVSVFPGPTPVSEGKWEARTDTLLCVLPLQYAFC